MEVAIPVIALGAMWVISNQKTKENFEERKLPNTQLPPVNYPIQSLSELGENINYYPNANATTDKYYKTEQVINNLRKNEDNSDPLFKSLTGNEVSASSLKHGNMVPFFGSHVRQRTVNLDSNESILDNLQGTGSQQIRKEAQAPLFAPQKNMDWATGTPNMSDFFQSRQNPAMKMSNVKPFYSQQVGPGLNQGYTNKGSGGFNSGMEARDKWISKSVDELRTKNNPKVTYNGVILGGGSSIQNRGIEGKIEKNRPDTFFINSPERYFTTPTNKAQKSRAEEILKAESRPATTREYFGSGELESKGPYIPGKYEAPHRPVLKADVEFMGAAAAEGRWMAAGGKKATGDYGRAGYNLPMNPRQMSNSDRFGTIAGTAIGAVVAPLLDVLRPSRKENVIGNLRPTGNMSGQNQSYVYNPAEGARMTMRETTEANPYPMYMNGQRSGGGYQTNPQQPVLQQRDSTSCSRTGAVGNTAATSNAPTYNGAYNAHLNANKSSISTAARGNAMRTGNMNLFSSEQNIQVRKTDQDRVNPAIMPGVRHNNGPAPTIYGDLSHFPPLKQGINCERSQPDILKAFACNPYTKPLNSVA